MEERELRVGIAGAGFIGAVHARSARLAGARLAGVAGSSAERAEIAARRLGAERAFDSALALAEAPDVDVVHVCTPNHLHLPVAEAALAAGKHVICEKPLALDAAGAERLTRRAAATDRCATVPFVYRYYPTVREARERIRSGRTGGVRLVHGTYLQDWLLKAEDDNWRVDAELGGASRAFADIGSHWCDLAEFVTGHRIARLSARTLTAVPDRVRALHRAAFAAGGSDGETRPVGTEDAAVMQFETDRGAIGTTVISQISAGRKNRLWLEVDTAEESFAFDQEQPETLWCGRRESVSLLRRDPAVLSELAARLSWLPAGHSQGWGDCFAAFIADAYAAIRHGAPVDGLPVLADGLRAARITQAVLESATKEYWVDVPIREPMEVSP
jgi:predicted dehydrogenase